MCRVDAMQDLFSRSRFHNTPVRAVTTAGNVLSQAEFDDLWYTTGEYVQTADPQYPLDTFKLIGAPWQPRLTTHKGEYCGLQPLNYSLFAMLNPVGQFASNPLMYESKVLVYEIRRAVPFLEHMEEYRLHALRETMMES